jgi:hypothetical protein
MIDVTSIPLISAKFAAPATRFVGQTLGELRFLFLFSGVILPGETVKIPFVFKSPNAGVFTEQWEFETRPVVCGGASLVVTLRGVAMQQDKFKKQRTELEVNNYVLCRVAPCSESILSHVNLTAMRTCCD